jgi:hypothetical protein
MSQVRHGGEQPSRVAAAAHQGFQKYLCERWDGHEKCLEAANEAIGLALGHLARGQPDHLPSAAGTLYKYTLQPILAQVHVGISQGHLKLTNRNPEMREALMNKLFNAITASHVLVSALAIAGSQVCHLRPETKRSHLLLADCRLA